MDIRIDKDGFRCQIWQGLTGLASIVTDIKSGNILASSHSECLRGIIVELKQKTKIEFLKI